MKVSYDPGHMDLHMNRLSSRIFTIKKTLKLKSLGERAVGILERNDLGRMLTRFQTHELGFESWRKLKSFI